MRWNLKRSKLLLALIPILSIVFYIFTVDHSLYADQSFIAFDIYRQICDTAQPVAGKNSPSDYSAAENFAIAADVYAKTDSVQCTITGQITAMGFYKQTVQNYHAKSGGYIFSESVSLSAIASVAEQRFFKDRALLYRAGSASGGSVKGWSDTIIELDPAVYRQRYGVVPQEITKYSVTKDSVESGSLVSANPDGTYTYELIMNAQEAQKYARYEMMTFAGVTAFPDYYSCRLVFTIDSDWRILELQSYDTYKIAIMGGTKCDSKLKGVYSYVENYMPERAQPFIDFVPTGNTGGVDSDKGPADYLSEAFGAYITGNEKLNISAMVTVKDTPLELRGQIDIENMDFRFALGNDIFIVYKGNSLYLASGGGKYSLDISDISNFISDVTGKPSDLLGNFKLDDSILGALFEKHEIIKTDSHVFIKMPFEIFGMNFNVTMGLKLLDDGTTAADTIDAVITLGETAIGVQARITDGVTLPEFDKKEYVSLKPALGAIANTVRKPSYSLSGNVSATLNDNVYSLPFSADIVKTENGANAEAKLSIFGVDIAVWYLNGTIYAQAGNIKIKAAANDFAQITQTIATLIPHDKIPQTDSAELIGKILPQILPNLDIQSLLGQLSVIKYADNKLSLGVTPQSGSPWSAEITHDTFLRLIAIHGIEAENVKIDFNCTLRDRNASVSEIVPETFTDVKSILKYIPAIKNLASAKSFNLKITEGSVVSDVFGGKISGTIKLNLPDVQSLPTAYINLNLTELDSKITKALGWTEASAEILFDGEYAYLTLGNFAVKGSIDDIMQILQKFGIALPSSLSDIIKAPTADLANLDIASILNMISVSESADGLNLKIAQNNKFDISILLNEAGYANITANAASDEASVNLQATLTSSQETEIFKPTERNYLNVADFVKFIDPVLNTIKAQTFKITLTDCLVSNGNYEEPFTGMITVSLRGKSPEISANVNISGQSIGLMYKENTVYIRCGKIALMLELKDAQTLLDSLMPLIADLPAFVGTILPNADIQAIEQVIKNLSNIIESFKPANKPETGDNLQSIIGTLNKLPAVIPSLSFDSLTSMLGGITVNGNEISINVTPSDGAPYSIAIKTAGEYLSGASISGLTFEGFTLNLNAELECNSEFNLSVGDKKDYVNLAALTELAPALRSLIGTAQNPANNYEISITESSLYSAVISGMITGTVNLAITPFKMQADLKLNSDDTVHDISFAYADKTVWLKINDIMLTSSLDDIERFKNEILSYGKQQNFDEYEVTDLAQAVYDLTKKASLLENLLGGKTLGEILGFVDSLTQNEDGTITAAVHIKDLSAAVTLIPQSDSLTLKISALNYSGAIYNSSVTLNIKAVPSFEVSIADKNEYVNLADLISYINPVMNTVNRDNYNISFGGELKSDNGGTTAISGGLNVIPTAGFADIYAKIELKEYSGDITENATPDKSTLFELYIIDAKDKNSDIEAFINYNGFYAKIKYTDALRILGSLCDMLDLDIPVIDALVADAYKDAIKTDVFNTMDIAGLDGLRNKINSLFAGIDISGFQNGNKLMNIIGLISDDIINKALKGISLSLKQTEENEAPFICVNIDNGIFQSIINNNVNKTEEIQKNYAEIILGHNGDKLTFIDIANLQVNGSTVNFKADLLDTATQITVPDNNWLDFSSADDLLYAIMNTADAREFHISGGVKLSILNALDAKLKIGATIKILPDGNTVAAIKLQVPYFALGALKASDSYIYFANNMLYFVVDNLDKNGKYESTSFESATVEQFLANPVDYLFKLVRLADWIKNLVLNSMNNSNGTPTDKLQEIIKNYSYTDDIVELKIGLAELSGNKNLSDLSLILNTDNKFLTGLYLNTKFAGIAELTLAGAYNSDGNITNKFATLDNLNYVDGHVVADKDGKFTTPLPYIDYGRSKETANAGLAADSGEILAIDNMEDALARLFPIEAAETFAKKATEKAEKANAKATAANSASQKVADCSKALAAATNERADIEKKLYGDDKNPGIPEDSFGYEFVLSQLNAAMAAEKRAQTQLSVARQSRADAISDAIEIAKDATYYAQKAFDAGEKLLGMQNERAHAAANNSAIATIDTLTATDIALKAAIQAATDAADVQTAASALLKQSQLKIIDTAEKITARCNNYTDTANSAFSSEDYQMAFTKLDNALQCSQAVQKAESAANKTAQTAEDENIRDNAQNAAQNAHAAIAKINKSLKNQANATATLISDTEASKANQESVQKNLDNMLTLLAYAENSPQLISDKKFMAELAKITANAAIDALDKYGKALLAETDICELSVNLTYKAKDGSEFISISNEASDRKDNYKVEKRINALNSASSAIVDLSGRLSAITAKAETVLTKALPHLDSLEATSLKTRLIKILDENSNGIKTAFAKLQNTAAIAATEASDSIAADAETTKKTNIADWGMPLRVTLVNNAKKSKENAQKALATVQANNQSIENLISFCAVIA